jgi:hypothetical protein
MRDLVKFIVIAYMLFLISCHSEVESLPEFPEMEVCNYEIDNVPDCKSIYKWEITEKECEFVGGTISVGSCPTE